MKIVERMSLIVVCKSSTSAQVVESSSSGGSRAGDAALGPSRQRDNFWMTWSCVSCAMRSRSARMLTSRACRGWPLSVNAIATWSAKSLISSRAAAERLLVGVAGLDLP